ncbi:MAG: UvrB/UvrC motif-containing protein, partial [Acidithiobacillus sp.]
HGRAILYADTVTGSMDRAMGETARRRQKQVAFNLAHGITPRGISKPVADIIEGVYRRNAPRAARAAEPVQSYGQPGDPKALAKRIKELEEAMYRHARNLEFEQAARLRDQIKGLERQLLGIEVLTAD